MLESVRQRLTPKVMVALAAVGALWATTAWLVFRRFAQGGLAAPEPRMPRHRATAAEED